MDSSAAISIMKIVRLNALAVDTAALATVMMPMPAGDVLTATAHHGLSLRKRMFELWTGNTGRGYVTIFRRGRCIAQIRTPRAPMLFSERNGYENPSLRLGAWRMFLYWKRKRVKPEEKDA